MGIPTRKHSDMILAFTLEPFVAFNGNKEQTEKKNKFISELSKAGINNIETLDTVKGTEVFVAKEEYEQAIDAAVKIVKDLEYNSMVYYNKSEFVNNMNFIEVISAYIPNNLLNSNGTANKNTSSMIDNFVEQLEKLINKGVDSFVCLGVITMDVQRTSKEEYAEIINLIKESGIMKKLKFEDVKLCDYYGEQIEF